MFSNSDFSSAFDSLLLQTPLDEMFTGETCGNGQINSLVHPVQQWFNVIKSTIGQRAIKYGWAQELVVMLDFFLYLVAKLEISLVISSNR